MKKRLRLILILSLLILAGIIGIIAYNEIKSWDKYSDINLEMFQNSSAPKPSGKYKILDCKNINQNDGYPTGCESVSAVMILKYYGMDITVENFINSYLDTASLVFENGAYTGPHPSQYYIGDPTQENGFGCFAPVIAKALKKCLSSPASRLEYSDTSGQDIEDLVRIYIENDVPVLMWVTINMRELTAGRSWILSDTGESYTWPSGEHCMVLVGYDDSHYYFNDPYKNNGLVAYDKNLVKSAYEALNKQSIVIYPIG